MTRIFLAPIAAILVTGLGAAIAAAQGTQVSVGSLTQDTSLPVEVTSDSLSVANEDGHAVFEGNVTVVQGPMKLAAQRIEVVYSKAGDGSTDVDSMTATGGVTYANGTDAAESREAVYSPEAGTLVMTGDVLLTQGAAAMSGQSLTVHLADGTGVMEGRVRTVFQQGN